MNFEDFQHIWSKQNAGHRMIIHTDLLLQEVRRNQQHFSRTIFWRDFREVGVALVMVVHFTNRALRLMDWMDGLLALACLGVGLFMLLDRMRQRRCRPSMSGTLKGCVEQSLQDVRHQVWLLRNVLWWYLLPLALPMILPIACSSLSLADFIIRSSGMWLVFGGVYWLNQTAVKRTLEPRQHELEQLLADLNLDVQK